MMMRMLMLMMMPFALTQKERHGSDDSGSDDSGSDRTESDFVDSSDSDGPAKKRQRKPMTRRGNKGQKAAKKQKKSQKAAAKQRNRASRAPADAAPAAASAPANDGYSCGACATGAAPLHAAGIAPRVMQASGGTDYGSRRAANLVGHDESQQEDTRHQRLPIRE